MSRETPGGKVFGVGLSKTGTTSLYVALHELGYRSATYRHIKKIRPVEWFRGDFGRDHLAAFDAVTDLPIGIFYSDLDRRYPGSKFVLTVRDMDSWLDSVRRHYANRPDRRSGFRRDIRIAAYGMSRFEPERFRFVYETHRRNVEWHFRDRPDDLLVLDIRAGEGWTKLCPFLEREVPDKPFPHVQPGHRVEGRDS